MVKRQELHEGTIERAEQKLTWGLFEEDVYAHEQKARQYDNPQIRANQSALMDRMWSLPALAGDLRDYVGKLRRAASQVDRSSSHASDLIRDLVGVVPARNYQVIPTAFGTYIALHPDDYAKTDLFPALGVAYTDMQPFAKYGKVSLGIGMRTIEQTERWVEQRAVETKTRIPPRYMNDVINAVYRFTLISSKEIEDHEIEHLHNDIALPHDLSPMMRSGLDELMAYALECSEQRIPQIEDEHVNNLMGKILGRHESNVWEELYKSMMGAEVYDTFLNTYHQLQEGRSIFIDDIALKLFNSVCVEIGDIFTIHEELETILTVIETQPRPQRTRIRSTDLKSMSVDGLL